MEKEKFTSLFEILKLLEHEDYEHRDVEHAIIDIMDKYSGDMSEDQRHEMIKELVKYEIKKQHEKEHLKEKLEEENYNMAMTSFYGEQYFSAT